VKRSARRAVQLESCGGSEAHQEETQVDLIDERVPPLHEVPGSFWAASLTWETLSREEMIQLMRRTSSENSTLQNKVKLLEEQLQEKEEIIKDLENRDTVENISSIIKANDQLMKQNKQLLQRLQDAHKRGYEEGKKEVCALFEEIFSEAQMQYLLTKRQVKWQPDDIAAALALHSFSRKSYLYVQRAMKIPLPSEATLKRWAAKIGVKAGLQDHVLKILGKLTESLPKEERLVCLSFDEMFLSQRAQYNQSSDSVVGPNKNAQVIMMRPVFGSWKQAIYFK
jgi:hypothetical protein